MSERIIEKPKLVRQDKQFLDYEKVTVYGKDNRPENSIYNYINCTHHYYRCIEQILGDDDVYVGPRSYYIPSKLRL